MKFLASFAVKGRMQAVMVATTLAFFSMILPPVSILSSATVSLLTLRKGAAEGAIILFGACLPMAVLGYFILNTFQFALSYGLVLWLPIWIISIILRESRRLALTFELAATLGAIGIILFYLYYPDPSGLWQALLGQFIKPMLDTPELPIEQVKQSIEVFSHFMTGVVVAASITTILLGLLMARWWQAGLYNPGGFREEYLQLKTGSGFAVGSVVLLAVALLSTGRVAEISGNILIVLFALYVFVGTAVLHALIAAMKSRRMLLPLFYLIIFIIPHALLPVALIGLGDSWVGLRKRLET